jgi:hypothetical protein
MMIDYDNMTIAGVVGAKNMPVDANSHRLSFEGRLSFFCNGMHQEASHVLFYCKT